MSRTHKDDSSAKTGGLKRQRFVKTSEQRRDTIGFCLKLNRYSRKTWALLATVHVHRTLHAHDAMNDTVLFY